MEKFFSKLTLYITLFLLNLGIWLSVISFIVIVFNGLFNNFHGILAFFLYILCIFLFFIFHLIRESVRENLDKLDSD